jgi:hypothetical protein
VITKVCTGGEFCQPEGTFYGATAGGTLGMFVAISTTQPPATVAVERGTGHARARGRRVGVVVLPTRSGLAITASVPL